MPPGRPGRWRTPVAAVLIGLAILLAPLSVASVWASRMVGDTDTYVDTVAPLAKDPAIQAAMARRITNEVFKYVDVGALTDQLAAGLQQRDIAPRAAQALVALKGPIEQGVQGFVGDKVDALVRSDAFASAWEQANRVAHEQLVAALTGKQGRFDHDHGRQGVGQPGHLHQLREDDAGRQRLRPRQPDPHGQRDVRHLPVEGPRQGAGGLGLLETLGVWLPLLAVALLLLGAVVARRPRRALLVGLLGIAVSMLLLGAALAIGRVLYLDALPDGVDTAAAAAVFDNLVRFLRVGLRTVLVLALVLAAATVLTGGTPGAVRTREWFARNIGSARSGAERVGWRTGPVGPWVWAHRRVLRVAAAALAALAYVFVDRPTAGAVILIAVILLVVLMVIEFVATPPQLAAAEPVAIEPVATEPAATEPAATEPAAPSGTPTG